MKKIISIALLLALCLSLFAACGKDAPEETPNLLPDAKAYLINMYQTAGKDEVMVLNLDKDVLSSVTIDGVKFNVEWTIKITEGASDSVKIIGSKKANHVTIDIPDQAETDILFTATATVKDSDGKTESASFNFKVNASKAAGLTYEQIVEEAYKLETGAMMDGSATLEGKITLVKTPYDPSYENITVIIQIGDLKDKKIECYRLKGDGAADLAIGDTIKVTGVLKNYNGTIEFDAGCVLESVVKGETITAPTDMKEIVKAAYALPAGESLPYEAVLTGVITSIKTPWDDGYGNISVIISVEGCEDMPMLCYRMKGDGAATLAEGDTITCTGFLTNYNDTIEFTAGCLVSNIVKGDGPSTPSEPSEPSEPSKPSTPSTPSEPSKPSQPSTPSDKVTLADGQYIIYVPAFNMALSSEYTGFYNKGVEFSAAGATETWTITNNGDGTICISINGKKLALGDSYSSMPLDEKNDKWVLIDAGNGLVYIQNVARGNYIEWYADKNNWSSYGTIASGKEGLFAIKLVAV
jgi:hypothetical protein